MKVTIVFRKMQWLMNINEEYLGERRSTENIEKVGLTYFFNLGKGESSSAKQCGPGAEGEKMRILCGTFLIVNSE